MIRITCHNDNIQERKYAIDILFHTLLEIANDAYEIVFDNSATSYILEFNSYCVIIEDHFFRFYPEPLSYLNEQNIPQKLKYFHAFNKEIPIIYGEDKFQRNDKTITIGIDVFASTFFMLTRWEESLIGREEKGDCDEMLLFTVKNNIYMYPIVHMYEEVLRELLESGGVRIVKKRKYHVVLSHDVDGFITPSWWKIAKDMVRQAIYGSPRNKVLKLTWKEEVNYKRTFPTTYSQFDMYTALSERNNIKEWFYFKVCDKGERESTYIFKDKQTRDIVEQLKEKNNSNIVLGFHPSQNIFGNREQWDREVSRITKLLHGKPIIGRNHHLLYNYDILRWWETITDEPMNISNCVFHKRLGFRNGICVPYHLFDLYKRRVMNLIERSCQIMDTVIRYDAKIKTEDERWRDVLNCLEQVRKYDGELVLTWHIYIRNNKLIQEYYKWCENVVRFATNQ